MQIETGKYYRTMDGGKIGPMNRYDDDSWCEPSSEGLWRDDGNPYFKYAVDSPRLVEEWDSGPVVTETITRIVPGKYGYITIRETHDNRVGILLDNNTTTHYFGADELDQLADLFTTLAKALRS